MDMVRLCHCIDVVIRTFFSQHLMYSSAQNHHTASMYPVHYIGYDYSVSTVSLRCLSF